MKQIFQILILVFIFLLFSNCEGERCFYKSGKYTEKVILIDTFKQIHVYGMFDIELVQDTGYFIEGVGGENIIDNIEATLKNDTLDIFNYNSCFWLREYERPLLRIHFSDINQMNLYETSYVFSTDSITDDFRLTTQCMMAEINLLLNNKGFFFYVHHKTAGKYIFSGKTENLYLDGYYCSIIDASQLESKKATIKNHSIADFSVWATEQLNAEIYNTGNIYYRGSPSTIIDTVKASGKLIQLQY